jgi:serine/threonine-protein kinase
MPASVVLVEQVEALCIEQRKQWRRGERPSVAELLAHHPTLAAQPDCVVELVYNEVLLREEQGETPLPNEYLERFPEAATQLQRLFEVRDALASRQLFRVSEQSTPGPAKTPRFASAGPTELPVVPGYEILDELGRGGMGVVYRARQVALNRIVALKMLLPGQADTDTLARFQREAEAVAHLQHPHIVQIHEIGTSNGHPYVCFEFVPGGSLAALLAGKPQPPRDAAQLVETLARAMHFAHEHGIIHRDLKPANILLAVVSCQPAADAAEGKRAASLTTVNWQRTTTPKVTDFGLAKKIEDGSGVTQTGVIIGTPSYMAPEQATGRTHDVGPTADLYALGAILYECLTGRPPFQGPTILDTLMQVRSTEPVSPRRLQPGVPRDLETICLKCLHKDPARRYASAADLADELQRFLQGRPIEARPVSRLERAWRWCRRNPVVATLTVLLLLTIDIGIAGLLVLWLRAEESAAYALKKADEAEKSETRAVKNAEEAKREKTAAVRARDEKEMSLQDARDAVTRCFALATEHEFFQLDGMDPARRLLLTTALEYHKGFLKQHGNDPTQRKDWLAQDYFRVAECHFFLDKAEEARRAHRDAEKHLLEVVASRPKDALMRYWLVLVYQRLGILLKERDAKAAFAAFKEAKDRCQALTREDAANPQYRDHLVQTYYHLGHLHYEAKQPKEALDCIDTAQKLCEQLVTDHPDNLQYRRREAQCLSRLALILRDSVGPKKALPVFEKARELTTKLMAARPRVTEYKKDLAVLDHDLGDLFMRLPKRELDTARGWYEKALAGWRSLASANPTVTEFRVGQAGTLLNLGTVHVYDGSTDQAKRCFQEARDLLEKVVKTDPQNVRGQYLLGASYLNLALRAALAQPSEAAKLFEKACESYEVLVKAIPGRFEYRRDLRIALQGLGEAQYRLDRLEKALTAFQDAVHHQRLLMVQAPQDKVEHANLSVLYVQTAQIQLFLGRAADAAVTIQERRKLWPQHPGELYKAACELVECMRVVGGKKKLTPEEQSERDGYAVQALEVLKQAVQAGFRDADRLRMDRELEPLRGRPEFLKLLVEVEKKSGS